MYYILRNNNKFGPYTPQSLLTYVNNGQILVHDVAIDATGAQCTVGEALKREHLKPKIGNAGSISAQIKKIGSSLIFPRAAMFNKNAMQDHRLLMLSIVGLTPSVLWMLPIGGFLVFYFVALYFSAIWGLFFYYFFRTPQVRLRTTMSVFFLTQIFVFVLWDITGLVALNPFYLILDMGFPLNMLGYIFGVGLSEEFAKAIPLLIIAWRSREPLVPQTLVYYGLMSGIAFGVFEGVQYQMGVNSQLDYTSAFFMNIARLTSLPFLHAIWCGIAGYFIAFAKLYPKFRRSLYVLAIGMPALIHGLYDTFCGSLLGMIVAAPIMAIGVLLLITYLKQGQNYQSILKS